MRGVRIPIRLHTACGSAVVSKKDGREPQRFPPPDEWMAELSEVPLLYQPGEAWLYTLRAAGCAHHRVSGQSLPEFLAERLFQPLRMVDTGFYVPADKLERLTSYYRAGPAGGLELADGPDGQWSTPPAFPLGNGGLVGTADDGLRSVECCWLKAAPRTVASCCRPIRCAS